MSRTWIGLGLGVSHLAVGEELGPAVRPEVQERAEEVEYRRDRRSPRVGRAHLVHARAWACTGMGMHMHVHVHRHGQGMGMRMHVCIRRATQTRMHVHVHVHVHASTRRPGTEQCS